MGARRVVSAVAGTAGVLCAAGAVATTAARYVPPSAAPVAPDTWGMATAFTDFGLAGYLAALALLGLSVGLRFSRLGTAATVGVLAGAVLHASWVWPWFVAGPPPTDPGPALRILAANLYFGEADVRAVAEAGRQADVLVLTEVTGPALERLRRLGVQDRFPYAGGGPLPGRGPEGTLVLSRFPVTATAELPAAIAHQNWLVTIEVPDLGPTRVAAVHPSPPLRGRSSWSADHERLRAALSDLTGPLIVAGDFNAVPSHWPMRRLRAAGLRSSVDLAGSGWQPTWPADRPGLPPLVAIDQILLGPGLTATAAGTVRVPGSDHLGVTAIVSADRGPGPGGG